MCLLFRSDGDFEVVFLHSLVDFKTLSITIREILELRSPEIEIFVSVLLLSVYVIWSRSDHFFDLTFLVCKMSGLD